MRCFSRSSILAGMIYLMSSSYFVKQMGVKELGLGVRWVKWMGGEKERFIFIQDSAFSLPHNGGYSSRPPGLQGNEVFGFVTYCISLFAGET